MLDAMHVDLMDVLSGYGASMRIGLGTLGPILGLAGKSFLEGPVYAERRNQTQAAF